MQKKPTSIAVVLPVLIGLSLAGCSSDTSTPTPAGGGTAGGSKCGGLSTTTTATIATNPGAQDLVVKRVKEGGFDKKYNLNLDVKSFQNPPATAQAITQHAVDLGFGGLTTMVQARAGGADVQVIGALATPANGVFVKKDSAINNLGDLKGKNVGSFTALGGAVTSLVQAIAGKEFGFDMLNGVNGKVRVAPDAQLLGLLDQGQLDAVILNVDATVVAQQSGTYKQILDVPTAFDKQFGYAPYYLGPVTTEQYSAQNCSVVRAFVSALHDALVDIKANSAVWTSYATAVGHPEAASAYQKLYSQTLITDPWSQTQIDAMKKLIQDEGPYLDSTFPKTIPDGLFTLDFPALNT